MLTSLRRSCRLIKADLDPKIITAARKHFDHALTAAPRLSVRLPTTSSQALVLQIHVHLSDLDSSLGTLPMHPYGPTRQWGWLFDIMRRLDSGVRVLQLHIDHLPNNRWNRIFIFCDKVVQQLSPGDKSSKQIRVEKPCTRCWWDYYYCVNSSPIESHNISMQAILYSRFL
jgi:hypothetical protein